MFAPRVTKFHRRCGDRVTLLNGNSTAIRNFVEFNHGLILSAEPLKDDIIFEVCVDRKVNVWNGSLEIGVTTLDPEFMELPATATKLRNTAWIMSGSSIVKDGSTLINSYGPELDTLREGDSVGVMKSSKAELMFFINGQCLGIAARELPPRVFAVIDLYGQCVQVSIMDGPPHGTPHGHPTMRPIMESSLDQIDEDPDDITASSCELDIAELPPLPESSCNNDPNDVYIPIMDEAACALVPEDPLKFHPRCGILIKLTNNNRSAERLRPLDDYNNGVVMTHRPLYDDELFEIRIDTLVDKWSGSIEMGVTTHDPASIRFPSTMTNMDTGTIMMSGCKVLVNGQGTCMEYVHFNLDELKEGDTVGMMKKSSGKLHYFINGVDQGLATDTDDATIWGVVDLYGMTVKVSIVDPCEDIDSNISINQLQIPEPISEPTEPGFFTPVIDENNLLFHTLRDSNVVVINDGKTAHRPNAFEFFNNGVVMTNRTLRTNELFQVRLDVIIPKWAGSIEIGVTQLSGYDIELPFKMSNAKEGTWAMTGEDVIRDGVIIIPQYVSSLNKLVENDTVGVMRRDMGILHFFVNGIDQGPAAFNVPEHVFGIIDLYGRVAQATIVDTLYPCPSYMPDAASARTGNAPNVYPDMCFHRVYGENSRLSRTRLSATRSSYNSEISDAVLFSSRPLKEGEMFEIRLDKLVDCWIGGLEFGVTAVKPDEFEEEGMGSVPSTATDLNPDTYILSGSAIFKDGECIRSNYYLNLDLLCVGSRVGLMWHADKSLHYYFNGLDHGKACYVQNPEIYAVVDLYGQCVQVTILQNDGKQNKFKGCAKDNISTPNPRALNVSPPPPYCFSEYCGDNLEILGDNIVRRHYTSDADAALVFSAGHLIPNELFEIKLIECNRNFAGGLRIGVTDINILNSYVHRNMPHSIYGLPHFTAFVDGNLLKITRPENRNDHRTRMITPSFEWLRPSDTVGLKKTNDGQVLIYFNTVLLDVAIEGVPDKVYVCMELYGSVLKIQAISKLLNNSAVLCQPRAPNCTQMTAEVITDDTEDLEAEEPPLESLKSEKIDLEPSTPQSETKEPVPSTSQEPEVAVEVKKRKHPLPYTFHYVHGENIKLCSSDTVAKRTTGFNKGIAVVSQPLRKGNHFRFRIDKVDPVWSGSASIGAMGTLPSDELPNDALGLPQPSWVIASDVVKDNDTFFPSDKAAKLNDIVEQSVLTLQFGSLNELVLDMDGIVLGTIAYLPPTYTQVYPFIDLYGRVQQVSILLHPKVVANGISVDLPSIAETQTEESSQSAECNETTLRFDRYETFCVLEPRSKQKLHGGFNYIAPEVRPRTPVQRIVESPQPGPSWVEAPVPQKSSEPKSKDTGNRDLKLLISKRYPNHICIPPAYIKHPPEDYDEVNRSIQKSHSSNNIGLLTADLDNDIRECLLRTFALPGEDEWNERVYDTNIQHNDRYPEVDVDNLDNEIINALILDPGTLPDLTEERTSSLDESTHRDDFDPEPACLDNLRYLHRLLTLSAELEQAESTWHASGEGCEHLHLVLKFWSFIVMPYPDLRQAVTNYGQVQCFCTNCKPDADDQFSGWVCIARTNRSESSPSSFWHVERSTVAFSQGGAMEPGPIYRPSTFATSLFRNAAGDIWFDEEGKPHHTIVALEIESESQADQDCLVAFYIYLKPHSAYYENRSPSSLDLSWLPDGWSDSD